MFKKLLLATLIVIIGLWGAGYDVTSVKDSLQHLADEGAQTATAGTGLDKRSEEHTSELQSLMRISYAVFCLKKKNTQKDQKKSKDTEHKNNTDKKYI